MTRKVTRKKLFQTVDGAEFLRAWRNKLDHINAEVKIGEELPAHPDASAKVPGRPPKPHKRPSTSGWATADVAKELALRQKGLTQKRPPKEASTITLPLTLKKVLVEQWEIITQCDMVPCVPASVSVRGALDRYLESKGSLSATKRLRRRRLATALQGPEAVPLSRGARRRLHLWDLMPKRPSSPNQLKRLKWINKLEVLRRREH